MDTRILLRNGGKKRRVRGTFKGKSRLSEKGLKNETGWNLVTVFLKVPQLEDMLALCDAYHKAHGQWREVEMKLHQAYIEKEEMLKQK